MKPRNWINIVIMVALLLSSGVFSSAPRSVRAETTEETIWYVIKGGAGANDCSSWVNACELQTALTEAGAGAEIWVATGVYTPGITVTDTFQLLEGVAIFGGFDPASDADQFEERDWEAFRTVLSGDIGGDDNTDANVVRTSTANITGRNSYHVVTASGTDSSAVLDGFTIIGGNANETAYEYDLDSPNDYGGGMYIYGGSPTLRNLTFNSNFALAGGGIYINNGSPTLTDVTLSNNSATRGGGMHNYNSSPTLTNVTFNANSANYYGLAMINENSAPILTSGGGMYNSNSNPTLTNVNFNANTGAYFGGGMCNSSSSPTLTNVTFSGNWAYYDGGGMANYRSSPTLTNVTFSSNSVDYNGGGMFNNNNSSPSVRNSILWNNQDSSGTGTITATIMLDSSSSITLTHSLAQGSGGSDCWVGGSYLDGGNNLDSDPLFVGAVDPAEAPTTGGDLHLQTDSPAIDAGDNQYVSGIATDLDGKARISGGTVDMGAYEKECIKLFLPLTQRNR